MLHLSILNKNIGICLCHAKEERCFKIKNFTLPICSRCLGIYFGVISGIILYEFGIKIPIMFVILLIIPLIVDGFTQLFIQRFSNNPLRFITGLLFII